MLVVIVVFLTEPCSGNLLLSQDIAQEAPKTTRKYRDSTTDGGLHGRQDIGLQNPASKEAGFFLACDSG